MNDAAYQEHLDHVDGCRTEAENCLTEARQGIKSDSLSFHKRFVFIIEHAVYCKSTDGFAGWDRQVVSSWDTHVDALSAWVLHYGGSGSGSEYDDERPDIIDQKPVAIPADDDECDFPF